MDNLRISHTFLAVDDPDKAVEFYRDALGLEVRNDVGYGDMRWITVGSPSQPEIGIVLEPPAPDPSTSAEDRRAITDLMAKGLFGSAVFWTDDVDATFERIRAAGADVIQEPTDQPFGVRDCAFRDPSGNHIRFTQTSDVT